MTAKPRAKATPSPRKPAFPAWSKAFLRELAATSNVSAAARKAGVNTFVVYEARRTNAEFNQQWQVALAEGYEHLEMELLHRLRTGEVKPAASARRGVRQFENGTALRLLIAHRESAARQMAVRNNLDADAIIDTINAKLERMRQRMLAAPDTTPADGEPA